MYVFWMIRPTGNVFFFIIIKFKLIQDVNVYSSLFVEFAFVKSIHLVFVLHIYNKMVIRETEKK